MTVAETLIQTPLLGEAIDGGPVAVLVADETMRYVAVNRYACTLLGYTREELLNLHVSDVARYASAAADFESMIEAGGHEGTVTLTRKDGTEFEFSYRACPSEVAGLGVFVSVGV